MYIHPQYVPPKAYFDIALLKIDAVEFDDSIIPICLPTQTSTDEDKYKAWTLYNIDKTYWEILITYLIPETLIGHDKLQNNMK